MKLSIKLLLIALFSFFFSEFAYSQVKVKGYTRKDGTYVKPHVRSNPDGNPYNNWSYPGNTNPYTGKTATGSSDAYLRNYYNTSSSSGSDVDVSGYFRSDGTYVQPHKRSAPDGNPTNNWSYPGNTNPYTNETATGNSNTYLNNYYNSSTLNNSYTSDIDWEEIQKENDRFWREEYPTIKAEQDKWWKEEYPTIKAEQDRWLREEYPKIQRESNLYFESVSNSNYYSNSNTSYKTEQAVKYHYRYSREDREILELALQKLGYYIGVADGTFDESTISGIKDFQRNSRVSADGKIGPNTMNKLLAKFN